MTDSNTPNTHAATWCILTRELHTHGCQVNAIKSFLFVPNQSFVTRFIHMKQTEQTKRKAFKMFFLPFPIIYIYYKLELSDRLFP